MDNYLEKSQKTLDGLKANDSLTILSIESSCDETAAAVLRGKQILSNVVSSQIDIHKRFGGVVPEIASRNHVTSITNVVSQAIKEANIEMSQIDAMAVTYGSGLLGALLVGVSFAKGLAYAIDKPLIPVNHIRGHIAVNYISNTNIIFPYVAIIVSGGHTALALVNSFTDISIIGQTQDDACGECIDKVARVLGLEYPGGPNLERLAKLGKKTISFPVAKLGANSFNFSYSGIKTAVINYLHNKDMKGEEYKKEDVAASFQDAVFKPILDNAIRLALKKSIKQIVLSGGVSANEYLRETLKTRAKEHKIEVFYPPKNLCTDNALMCACEARALISEKKAFAASLDLDAVANLEITDIHKSNSSINN